MIGIGYGAKSAITIDANACVTGSFMALQSVVTGSATITTATATGPTVDQGGSDEISVTQLTDIVWGDGRNTPDGGYAMSSSGTTGVQDVRVPRHHFASHSVATINLPAGATLNGPIYSFKVVAGSLIGYMSQRSFNNYTCDGDH